MTAAYAYQWCRPQDWLLPQETRHRAAYLAGVAQASENRLESTLKVVHKAVLTENTARPAVEPVS